MYTPITPERRIVRQYLKHIANARQHRIDAVHDRLVHRLGEHREDFGESECADQCRNERDAAGEVGHIERETVVGMDSILTDEREE